MYARTSPRLRKIKSLQQSLHDDTQRAKTPLPPSMGRVRKVIAGRNTLKKKCPSLVPAKPPLSPSFDDDVPCLPTSPVSSQDTVDLESRDTIDEPLVKSTNFALGFEPTGPIIGRVEEQAQITQLLSSALSPEQPPTSVYICGTPGTGKTFTVSNVIKRLRSGEKHGSIAEDEDDESCLSEAHCETLQFDQVWVNCANLNHPKDLFSVIVNQLGIDMGHSNARDAIREFASSSGRKALIVLDEVDFLTSKDQMVLYSAFEWPRIPNSRLVVVGIANSIDLPVRLLPWLRASRCMPEIVPFTPYTAASLQSIVQQRIHGNDDSKCKLNNIAILLAAKKVAAGSGDARLMLDVCREAQSEIQQEGNESAPIAIVSSILNRRGGLSAAVETIRQLPVQQQLALCVAANAVLFSTGSAEGKGKLNKKATLGGLYESFVRMCKRAHVSCLSFHEYADICCNALVHHGLLDIPLTGVRKGAKTLRGRAVRLRVPIEDVRAGIANKGFLPLLLGK